MPDPDAPLDLASPHPIGRRAFVRGCVLASAGALVAGGMHGAVSALDLGGGPVRRVDYLGAMVVGGPAPQGLPLLPLRAGPEGQVRGNPRPDGLDGGVLDWYRYCGHERMPALQAGFESRDEALRYDLAPDRLQGAQELRALTGREDVAWQQGLAGQPLRPEHFRAPGFGTTARWRGEVNAIVLKVDPAALAFEGGPDVERTVRAGFLLPTPDGHALLGYVAFCKHLCCIPGWHESRKALQEGDFERIYCTCHFSVFDPLRIAPDFFVLREA